MPVSTAGRSATTAPVARLPEPDWSRAPWPAQRPGRSPRGWPHAVADSRPHPGAPWVNCAGTGPADRTPAYDGRAPRRAREDMAMTWDRRDVARGMDDLRAAVLSAAELSPQLAGLPS